MQQSDIIPMPTSYRSGTWAGYEAHDLAQELRTKDLDSGYRFTLRYLKRQAVKAARRQGREECVVWEEDPDYVEVLVFDLVSGGWQLVIQWGV
jgi:hypothetical protein